MPPIRFRMLGVDLGSGDWGVREIPQEVHRNYLGGTTLAAQVLYTLLTEALNPRGADAPLVLLTGPLTGTAGPAVGRAVLCAKSPATNLWGESNIGGHLGSELRSAGYDGLLVTGRGP